MIELYRSIHGIAKHGWTVNVKINGGDVQRKNVVNNVDKSSLWAPWQTIL